MCQANRERVGLGIDGSNSAASDLLLQQKMLCSADMDGIITNLARYTDNTCSRRRKDFNYKSRNFNCSNLPTSSKLLLLVNLPV